MTRTSFAALATAALAGLFSLTTTSCGGECGGGAAPEPSEAQQVLLDPGADAFAATAPDTFVVRFQTSEGDVVIQVQRDWAPLGADRFYNLVRNGYYDGVRFFRVIPGFMAQFGIHGVPEVDEAWMDWSIPDDPVRYPNERGTVTFAMAGPDTRTTQLFINYRDNTRLDADGFAPIGRVIEGMDVVDRFYGEYGETAPGGLGPAHTCMLSLGNRYLERRFERLDSIVRATIVREANAAPGTLAPPDSVTADTTATPSIALLFLATAPEDPAEHEESDERQLDEEKRQPRHRTSLPHREALALGAAASPSLD
jgi:cyclophilin family peptidyl-prolyl cis-trans isomerase